jgi:predicted GH43/DUF377 family glycosyl hydrolase
MISDIGNFSKKVILDGGKIVPLLVQSDKMIGPSLMNPSILNINGKLLVNLRNVNYVLYHAEDGVNEHVWGPLCYLHTEQNAVLATHNILCYLDDNFNIVHSSIVDTSQLDQKPLWEFIGLEDARLVYWNNKLFLSGVRRDTTANGQGRIELSEVIIENNITKEISRQRLPAPLPNNSYCEKNWMPIVDRPYEYVKWTNPTEVVRYNPTTQTTETIVSTKFQPLNTRDLRGGSQVIPYKNHYLAVLHEVDLFRSEAGRKNATYRHRFALWDKNFNLLRVSPVFDFMEGKIEFACGMTEYNDQILITFGFQDNIAYLLAANKSTIDEMVSL